jgi:lipopolysaccharide export system protein LptA
MFVSFEGNSSFIINSSVSYKDVFLYDLTIQIYNAESAKETRVDRTIASRDSRPSENQVDGPI